MAIPDESRNSMADFSFASLDTPKRTFISKKIGDEFLGGK